MKNQAGQLSVLYYLREDARESPGGDLVEASILRDELVDRGHFAEVAGLGQRNAGPWNVVHLFNIVRAAELAEILRRNGNFPQAKVILSPIYCPGTSRSHGIAGAFQRYLQAVGNLMRFSRRPSRYWVPGAALAAVRSRVDGLVFHSPAEKETFDREYPGFGGPATVIPPPTRLPPAASGCAPRLTALRPYVAVVGRIEPLKGQIWLMRSGLDRLVRILFVGAVNPKRQLYGVRFRRLLAHHPNCHYLGPMDRAGVRAVMENAVAHLLPSHRENFGLVTTEALSAGCEAIVPRHHLTATILDGCVHTFDLARPDSLVATVRRILAGEKRAQGFPEGRFSPGAVTSSMLHFYASILRPSEVREMTERPIRGDARQAGTPDSTPGEFIG
ncbi:MAG: glycosyltransferase [bacterium]|nr:glycosyltransferase [bacterium]